MHSILLTVFLRFHIQEHIKIIKGHFPHTPLPYIYHGLQRVFAKTRAVTLFGRTFSSIAR